MQNLLRTGAVIKVPNDQIGETVVDEVFTQDEADRYKDNHVVASRCDTFVGRDAGDNLFVLSQGEYMYWDHETDILIPLGRVISDFVVGYEE